MEPSDQNPHVPDSYTPTPEVIPTATVTGAKVKKVTPIKIIFIVLGALFVIAILAAVLLNSGKKKPAPAPQTQTTTTSQNFGKAKAIDVENINNSINQNLGSLSNEHDFPSAQFDDKSIGL
jgi:hypothetical protein